MVKIKKWLKQHFPSLVKIKRIMHNKNYYRKMRNRNLIYAEEKSQKVLDHLVDRISQPMINTESGYDIIYQKNKAYNLKILSRAMTNTIIYPKQVFSFWILAKDADQNIPYKDGLVLIDGKIEPLYGGGLCQMSNVLYELFLHSSLTILERHTHKTKSFPSKCGDVLGIDATVSEGWKDLKVLNQTEQSFQVIITTENGNLTAELRCDMDLKQKVELYNKNLSFEIKEDGIHEVVDVYKRVFNDAGRILSDCFLYRNDCLIGYKMEGREWKN